MYYFMRKFLSLIVMLVMGMTMLMAQTKTVTGTVVSAEDGEPIIGASVIIPGTTTGTVTDIDGNFSLKVPENSTTLSVSYIGMNTETVTIGKGKLNITLATSDEILDEVMVVAYGTAKKSAFTGSAAVVKSEEIGKVQTTNAVNALNGKVAGVQMTEASGQPGQSSPSIRVRGISSISAGNAPLIILDGTPFDGDLNTINSQDIESMTVLKDAASNALYGARGANGVIMITTKKGKMGETGKIVFDAKWGSNQRATRRYNTINNPALYYETYFKSLTNYAQANGMDANGAWVWANQNICSNNAPGLGYCVYTVPENQYLIGQNGKLNPNATMGNVVSYGGKDYLLTADDWLEEAYKNSLRQEYNVAITNATDKGSFYASLNYLDNQGITANSEYQRLAARLKADSQVKSWFKLSGNFSYTHYNGKSVNSSDDGSTVSSGNMFAAATQVAPIYPLYIRDGQGNIMTDGNGLTMRDYGKGDNAGRVRPVFNQSNAIDAVILDTDSFEGNAFGGSGIAEVLFTKELKFVSTNTVGIDETRSSGITNPYYGSYASSNGIVSKVHNRTLSYSFQQLLQWNHTFGDHNVDLMAGHESYRKKYVYLYAYKTNMFDPTNIELNGAVLDGSPSSYSTDYNTEGFFARAQYNYAEKYFASASFRRDASSRFHPDNRWGNFWSMGGAWILSKESFMESTSEWLNMLKVKASYGEQGNDAIGDYRYTNTYDIVNSNGNPAAIPAQMGNKNITWETNANFNAGIEFGLWNDRISGQVEYFYRKTSDMLYRFPLPPSFGFSNYYANIGDMTNNGVEVELNGDIIRTRDFNWSVSLNFTHYKNEVTKMPDVFKTLTVEGHGGYASGDKYIGEGLPLYTFYIPKYAGVDRETGESMWYKDVKDDNGNVTGRETTKTYSEATQYLCDTALPDLNGGFGTNLKWKGLDFSIDYAFQLGGQVLDNDYADAMTVPYGSVRGRVMHTDLLDAWSPENKGSNIPRLNYGDSYAASSSDRFLTDASYLALNNITAGYTLPNKLTRKFLVEGIRFYFAADNVFVASKRQGLDPRQSLNGSSTGSYYAPIRSISGGISLTF